MYFPTTYEFVKINFPQHLEILIKKKTASSSKSSHFPIEEFDFNFSVGISIDACPNPFVPQPEPPLLNEEEYKEDLLNRMHGCIEAKKDRCILYANDVDFRSCPPQSALDFLEESWQCELKSRAEKERFNSLSPQDQRKEIESLLRKFTGELIWTM